MYDIMGENIKSRERTAFKNLIAVDIFGFGKGQDFFGICQHLGFKVNVH